MFNKYIFRNGDVSLLRLGGITSIFALVMSKMEFMGITRNRGRWARETM